MITLIERNKKINNIYLKSKEIGAIQSIKRVLKAILLGIIPLFFLITWFLFSDSRGSYHNTMMDPEYAYLLNGVVMIDKDLKVDYFDHPGTTLELFIAGTVKSMSVFRNKPLNEDVLKNPELYLKGVSLLIISVFIVLLFGLGLAIYNKTRNLSLALLIQSTPLVYDIPHYMARVFPEAIGIILIFIIIYLIINAIETPDEKLPEKKCALLFSLAMGILMATKISFFPVFFIPLFILEKNRVRLLYFGLTIVFFLVFAYPVLFKFDVFFRWIKSITVHSGRYGSGSANFIDLHDFIVNLKYLYRTYKAVFILQIINVILLTGVFISKYLLKKPSSTKIVRAMIGLTICILLQTIIVSKHFSLHYYLPAVLLISLNICLIIRWAVDTFNFRFSKLLGAVGYLIPLVFILSSFRQYVTTDIAIRYNSLKEKEKTEDFMKVNLSDKTIAYNSEAWNAQQEFAVWFGHLFTNKYKSLFIDELKGIYPNKYFYVDQLNCYVDWDGERYSLQGLLNKHDSIFLYSNRIGKNLTEYIPNHAKDDPYVMDTTYYNDKTNEIVVEVRAAR